MWGVNRKTINYVGKSAKCPKAFYQDCYISCQEDTTEYVQCLYLLKPLGFFHLLNKAQVCLCTGTGGTLELLETCSHCSDIWKLKRNKMVQQIQITVYYNSKSYNYVEFRHQMLAASHLNWNKLTLGVCFLFHMLCTKKHSKTVDQQKL